MFEYYYCDSTDHYVADYKFQIISKEFAKNLQLKKKQDKKEYKPCCITKYIKKYCSDRKSFQFNKKSKKPLSGRKHKYTTAKLLKNINSNIKTESLENNSNTKPETKQSKKAIKENIIFITEKISKSTPVNWALNTKTSSLITD